jgi:uncharacterized NAD(P)/FAD-binding protein YdhS
MTIRYCIVGTGFSGTCMIWHLVDALQRSICLPLEQSCTASVVEIITVERRKVNGPGLPYDLDQLDTFHLCNNPAEKMSICGNDFVDWMSEHRDRLVISHSSLIHEAQPKDIHGEWKPDGAAFYPRALFGLYLSERFQQACTIAKELGITIRNYNGYEATDGFTDGGKFHLTIKNIVDGLELTLPAIDRVLIASGHWIPERATQGNVVPSPYPAGNVGKIIRNWQSARGKKQLTILVKGMGPSAVDAVLTVCKHGQFVVDQDGTVKDFTPSWSEYGAEEVKILAVSRSGFFPGVRFPLVNHEFQYLTALAMDQHRASNDGFVSLSFLLHLLDQEIREATSCRLGIDDLTRPKFEDALTKLVVDATGNEDQRVLHTIVLGARRMRFYQYLRPQEKKVYDYELDSHFIRAAVPIPFKNASKLIALMRSGVLSANALGYAAADGSESAKRPLERAIQHDVMICSSGQNYDLSLHPSIFTKRLMCAGEIVAYEEGGYRPGGIAASESQSYRIRNNLHGRPSFSTNLFSFGPITQYWQNQNNYAAAFVHAAQLVAAEWVTCTLQQTHTNSPLRRDVEVVQTP